MSEHQRNDADETTQVVGLLDRAATHTPPLHVGHDEVVARGRRIRSGRRRTAAGVGALALAGTLWLGVETLPFGGEAPPAPAPASVGWSDGSIDTELFDNGANPEYEPGRTHFSGRLRTVEGGRHPELVLTRDGGATETIVGEDGPGESEVFRADGITVLVWVASDDVLGQDVLWTPGSESGTGGVVEVPGGQVHYATAEHVPGAEADAVELYLLDEEGARAASGAPVESVVLETEDMTWVVGIDLEREFWIGADASQRAGWGHPLPLVDGAAYEGGLGEVPSYVLGMLPAGASDVVLAPDGVRSDTELVAGQQVVLVSADEGAPLPTVQFTLDGEQHDLSRFVETVRTGLDLGTVRLDYRATPTTLDLDLESGTVAVPPDDLAQGVLTAVPVEDGTLVVVPDWAPSDGEAAIQVALDDGSGTEEPTWVEVAPEGLAVRELFDGRPVTFLGLEPLAEGTQIVGVGVSAPDGSMTELDVTEVQVRSVGD